MNKLIYYPGFEIKDENWLKFALLYIDELHPIIPDSGLIHLSKNTKSIINNTDLIKPHVPDYNEGEKASKNALDKFECYLRNPERYTPSIGKQFDSIPWLRNRRSLNMVEKWRNEAFQTFTLFSEKYSYEFEYYCKKEGIAHSSNGNLNISEELAYVYMSFLADEISDNLNLDSITDHYLSNELLISNKRRHDKMKMVQRSIQMEIPRNIQNIELNKIIQLRADHNFNKLREKYVFEIDNYFKDPNATNNNYIDNDNMLNYKKEIGSIILVLQL